MGLLKQIVSCNKSASLKKDVNSNDKEKLPPLLEEELEELAELTYDPEHETDL